MKKNISINISGIIFHIEEDGYEQLKEYLESINRYFRSFEDSKEIIDDIESRIAEIFLTKLREGNQVITKENVQELVATMGSVADFEAIEEQEIPLKEETPQEDDDEKEYTRLHPRKLYRDGKRKIIGGVGAGLANYFNIDPLWIRLLFIVLLFSKYVTAPIFLIYIILWIILPVSFDLADDKAIKKLYRDTDDRIFGGVASGVAAYFGTDVTIIRIVFIVITLLGFGAGIVIYFILWIITPSAITLTEKMEMKGDPVTLKNIESTIKRNLKVEDHEEENLFIKIILFPFRLLAVVFTGLGRVLGPTLLFVVEAIRVLAGLVLGVAGLAGALVAIVMSGALLGLYQLPESGSLTFGQLKYPLEVVSDLFAPWSIIAFSVFLIIPFIGLSLAGLALMLKRKVGTAIVGWSLFATWVVSLIVLAFSIPRAIQYFNQENTVKIESIYSLNGATPVLDLTPVDDQEYRRVELKIRGYKNDSSQLKLIKYITARGIDSKDAGNNASEVTYNVLLRDSILYFDSHLQSDAAFRMEEVDLYLYVPYDQPFVVKAGLIEILDRNNRIAEELRWGDESQTWVFSSQRGLINADENYNADSAGDENFDEGEKEEESVSWNFDNEPTQRMEIGNFTNIEVNGNLKVRIRQSEEPHVEFVGSDNYFDQVNIMNEGGTLKLNAEKERIGSAGNRLIMVNVYVDRVKKMAFGDNSSVKIQGLDIRDLNLYLSGNSKLEANFEVDDLNIRLEGNSSAELSGDGDRVEAQVSGSGNLTTLNFIVEEMNVISKGAGKADVYAEKYLDASASGVSRIRYRGNPQTNFKAIDSAKIERK